MEEQKIARRDGIRQIPNEVLEEIMLRLSVKSLIRFQVVSKLWRGMITSSRFRERYMVHQKSQEPKFLCIYRDTSGDRRRPKMGLKTMKLEWSSALLAEEEESPTSNEQLDLQMTVSKSVDGLFSFYDITNWTRPMVVINPATGWSQTLPLASIQLDHENRRKVIFPCPGFGKDSVTGTYKLVLLHDVYAKGTTTCELFDFGVKQWRQVISPQVKLSLSHGIPTFANGWLYWFTQDITQLVAFDLHTEMFRVVPNPLTPSSTHVEMHMESIDDGSRLVCISETNRDGMQHVWSLTNHNTGGLLLKIDKILSLDSKKLNSTWFDTRHDDSLLLRLTSISKIGDHLMFTNPSSQKHLLLQPLNPTSILYRLFSYLPGKTILVPYFPSLASP